jgi:hypothetical protein
VGVWISRYDEIIQRKILLLHPIIDALSKPILCIYVRNYFESSLVLWPCQNSNDFMPRNTDNYGDRVKMIFRFSMCNSAHTQSFKLKSFFNMHSIHCLIFTVILEENLKIWSEIYVFMPQSSTWIERRLLQYESGDQILACNIIYLDGGVLCPRLFSVLRGDALLISIIYKTGRIL